MKFLDTTHTHDTQSKLQFGKCCATRWHSTFQIKCEKSVRCLHALLKMLSQENFLHSDRRCRRHHIRCTNTGMVCVEIVCHLRVENGGRHCLVCFYFKCFDYHNGQSCNWQTSSITTIVHREMRRRVAPPRNPSHTPKTEMSGKAISALLAYSIQLQTHTYGHESINTNSLGFSFFPFDRVVARNQFYHLLCTALFGHHPK